MPPTERKPGTDQVAPDTASSYGREKPGHEAGQGRLDNNIATPTQRPDQEEAAVDNRQVPHQINAQDEAPAQSHPDARPEPLEVHEEPTHSLLDEEPRGEDLAPQDIKDPRHKRHPRTEGKGGTP